MICFNHGFFFVLDVYTIHSAKHFTLFIHTLCKAFDSFGYQLDLLLLMTFINYNLSKYKCNIPGHTINEQGIIINVISGLTKLVKFEKKN